jgi:peptidoglycan/LPS O-acetylase OafA/YrhL
LVLSRPYGRSRCLAGAAYRRRVTLGERLAGRGNGLNALRLALALVVVASHSRPLGGLGDDPRYAGISLGQWAVAGFFAISGYLIPQSRLRLSFFEYTRRRIRRIYPGFLTALAVTAFVLAPMAAWVARTEYSLGSAVRYVVVNCTTIINQWAIGPELLELQNRAWNGSLWSLAYEVGAYLLAGVLLFLPAARRHQLATSGALLVACTVAVLVDQGSRADGPWALSFFAAGWLIATSRSRLLAHGAAGAAAFAVAAGAALVATPLAALPLAYAVLTCAALVPSGPLATHDVSYGTYLYGFPVQQVLALLGAPALGLLPYMALSMATAVLFGAASWCLVERRFLGRRSARRVKVSVDTPGPLREAAS